MSAGTLHEAAGHGDEDFNWRQLELEMLRVRGDVGYGMSPGGYVYMTQGEVGAQRLGRMTMGAGDEVEAARGGNVLSRMADQEAAQRLAQMSLRNY